MTCIKVILLVIVSHYESLPVIFKSNTNLFIKFQWEGSRLEHPSSVTHPQGTQGACSLSNLCIVPLRNDVRVISHDDHVTVT